MLGRGVCYKVFFEFNAHLRSKRVAPVLIREITRRVNQQKIFQAVYTAGVVLPKPVGVCRWEMFFMLLFPLCVHC